MLQTNNGAFVVQKKGELPEGRSQPVASNSSTPYPFNESEIDRELNELRNKTKDFWDFDFVSSDILYQLAIILSVNCIV